MGCPAGLLKKRKDKKKKMKVQLLQEIEEREFKPISFKITFESKEEIVEVHNYLRNLSVLFELYNSLENYLFNDSFKKNDEMVPRIYENDEHLINNIKTQKGK